MKTEAYLSQGLSSGARKSSERWPGLILVASRTHPRLSHHRWVTQNFCLSCEKACPEASVGSSPLRLPDPPMAFPPQHGFFRLSKNNDSVKRNFQSELSQGVVLVTLQLSRKAVEDAMPSSLRGLHTPSAHLGMSTWRRLFTLWVRAGIYEEVFSL